MPLHSVLLNKFHPQEKQFYQCLLGIFPEKENYMILAILSHLSGAEELKDSCKIHNPEVQAH